MVVTESTLDEFVAGTDQRGGPGTPECDEYWTAFSYQPTYQVNQDLDPFSEAYVDEQLKLYAEMSARLFDQTENEKSLIDLTAHINAVNPYNHPSPSGLAVHTERLSKAFRLAKVPRGGRLLDMGCGWGLSSELGAYLGLRVTAVDINEQFVDLVNARAQRSGWDIKAVRSAFDTYVSPEKVDAVLFYECLHHAVRPWTLIKGLADALKIPDGKIVLAGEPINDIWWRNWGLRLDAISVYCIRKYGWFESGWSEPFLREVFRRAGLTWQLEGELNSDVGITVIASRARILTQTGVEFINGATTEGFTAEERYAVFAGKGSLDIVFPANATSAQLSFQNFRAAPVNVQITAQGAEIFAAPVPSGPVTISVPRKTDTVRVEIHADAWVPADEMGNGDTRQLSIHLADVAFF